MVKSVERYCRHCKSNTFHDQYKDINDAFSRIFLAIGTLGFSEAINDTIYECQRCGEQRTIG